MDCIEEIYGSDLRGGERLRRELTISGSGQGRRRELCAERREGVEAEEAFNGLEGEDLERARKETGERRGMPER
jgi:hypothetical protein